MKSFLFDFDGTLANTQKPILKTLKGTLLKLDANPPKDIQLIALIGMPLKEIFNKAAHNGDNNFLNEAVRIYRNDFFDNCRDNLELFPGVRDTLDNLQKKGHILTITSSRGRESLLRLTDILDISKYFDLITGEEDVKNPKPSAELANFVISKLSLARDKAMAVGDTIYDIGMGKAAKIRTCAVTYGNQKRELLEKANPDWLIDEFNEMEKIM